MATVGFTGFKDYPYSGAVQQHPELYIRIASDYEGRSAMNAGMRMNLKFTPTSFSDEAQANWSEQSAMGRSEPWQAYSDTSARRITFEIQLQAEGDPLEDVVKPARWLQALQYPIYFNNVIYRPPIVYLVWGDLLTMRAFCNQSSVTYNAPWTTPTTSSTIVTGKQHY